MTRFTPTRLMMALLASACIVFALGLSNAAFAADPAAELEKMKTMLPPNGPGGEKPVSAAEIKLSAAELAQIKAKKAKAAIVLHYSGNDWSRAQVEGLRAQFKAMGVEVIAVTDAGFKAEKQVADIETVLAQKPDIIVSVPTDTVATAAAYKKAADAGVKVVFMGNVPKGLVHERDYVSNVGPNDYGSGVASAHLMALALGPAGGEIGMVSHAAKDFFQTRQRYDGFKKTMADHYPNIRIVADQGIGGPDFPGDASKAASAMLTVNRNIKAIWGVWDVPAEGIIGAARDAGRKDLIIITVDLGQNVAIDMAKGGFIKGVSAQRPYDQGVTEAMLAGYGLIGKKAPGFVAWPIIPVTKKNVLEAWKMVYHTDAPANLVQSVK